jgi:hypothetical protein
VNIRLVIIQFVSQGPRAFCSCVSGRAFSFSFFGGSGPVFFLRAKHPQVKTSPNARERGPVVSLTFGFFAKSVKPDLINSARRPHRR